jgi:predicted flap endonuclease-1-like 5' DNA nuclease
MTRLTSIEGIGDSYGKSLEDAGIQNQEQLLEKGASPAGRKAIADSTGISGSLILKWVNRADLARVKGIGEEYADLLEAAGVDTVPELAQRNAENLYAKLEEVNAARSLVRQLPAQPQVADWVSQAQGLPRVITY